MNKYKSDDYKLSAVHFYLKNNKSMDDVCKIYNCKIYNCKKSTLKSWVDRYKNNKNVSRKIRKSISYKVRKEQVRTAF